jgi:hypothetical protein
MHSDWRATATDDAASSNPSIRPTHNPTVYTSPSPTFTKAPSAPSHAPTLYPSPDPSCVTSLSWGEGNWFNYREEIWLACVVVAAVAAASCIGILVHRVVWLNAYLDSDRRTNAYIRMGLCLVLCVGCTVTSVWIEEELCTEGENATGQTGLSLIAAALGVGLLLVCNRTALAPERRYRGRRMASQQDLNDAPPLGAEELDDVAQIERGGAAALGGAGSGYGGALDDSDDSSSEGTSDDDRQPLEFQVHPDPNPGFAEETNNALASPRSPVIHVAARQEASPVTSRERAHGEEQWAEQTAMSVIATLSAEQALGNSSNSQPPPGDSMNSPAEPPQPQQTPQRTPADQFQAAVAVAPLSSPAAQVTQEERQGGQRQGQDQQDGGQQTRPRTGEALTSMLGISGI